MLTGFNDIDQRCDRYLAWIDRKRSERLSFKSGLGAAQTLIGGFLGTSGASGESLAYVTQAFGFANTAYDAANTSVIMNLEPSTIKTIVYERRMAYRDAASDASITNRPALVYALRNYLMICTPQTIVLDVNTFSRGLVQGVDADLADSARRQFETFGPISADAPATTTGAVTRPPSDECPHCPLFFTDHGNWNQPQLEAGQIALCQNSDKIVGADTREAIGIAERQIEGATLDGRVSLYEYATLVAHGCQTREEAETFRNFYEVSNFRDSRVGLIRILNAAYLESEPLPQDAAFGPASALRRRIEAASLELGPGLSPRPPEGELTPELRAAIDAKARALAQPTESSQ